eukprot:scaffold101866_cov55-Attheya_sp.AAC.1
MFSTKSAFLIDALFRVDWGLMELHKPQARYKEVISSPRTVSNHCGVKSAFLIDALFPVDWGLMELHKPQD